VGGTIGGGNPLEQEPSRGPEGGRKEGKRGGNSFPGGKLVRIKEGNHPRRKGRKDFRWGEEVQLKLTEKTEE